MSSSPSPFEIKQALRGIFPSFSSKKISKMVADVRAGRLQLINSWESFENYLDIKRNNASIPYIVVRNEIATVSFDTWPVSTENSNIFRQLVPAGTANFTICPFSTISGRNWMAGKMLTSDECPFVFPVMLFGDGPFEKLEFARFLNRCGLHVYLEDKMLEDPEFDDSTPEGAEREFQDWDFYGNRYAPIIVCGQKDFDTNGFLSLLIEGAVSEVPKIQLPSQLANLMSWIERFYFDDGTSIFRRSKSLKDLLFISQEMLLASLFTEQQPRSPYGAEWEGHITHHKALSRVKDIRARRAEENKPFAWPKTDVEPGNGTLADQRWPQVGMLKCLGYNVGHNGALRTDRQKALQLAFTAHELPKVNGPEYVKGWGNASTGVRLKKIADSIATFCRNARHQNSKSYTATIADYEEDLAWLKKTYYNGRFDRQFTWPDTKQY